MVLLKVQRNYLFMLKFAYIGDSASFIPFLHPLYHTMNEKV